MSTPKHDLHGYLQVAREAVLWKLDGLSEYDGRRPLVPTGADMWVTPDESREEIVALYRRAWAHSDATIEALDLESVGRVPWWPPDRNDVTLHRILVHVATETYRHAGHADIVRELIDGSAGLRPHSDNLPDRDAAWWTDYRARIEQAASSFKPT